MMGRGIGRVFYLGAFGKSGFAWFNLKVFIINIFKSNIINKIIEWICFTHGGVLQSAAM